MDKVTLIKNKIAFIEESIKSLKKKSGREKALFTIGGCFCLGLGLTFFLTNPLIGLATITPISLFYLARNDTKESVNNLIGGLEKEKKHLEALQNKELNNSQQLNKKRKNKIKELNKTKEIVNKNKRNNKISAILCATTAAIGSLITLTSIWGLVFQAVGMVIFKEKLDKITENDKKENHLDTRINNLQNDLAIINSEKRSVPKMQTNHLNKKNNSNRQVKRTAANKDITQQAVSTNLDKANEEAVDKYLESLETDKSINNPKRRVKY